MKLEYIMLENFRQFYGRNQADFSAMDDLKVTVFHGLNGTGKTSLFSAISWCLYGVGTEEIGELASKEALSKVSDGESVTTAVIIGFQHEANRFIAKRSIETKKIGNSTRIMGPAEFTLTQIRASGDHRPEPNPSLRMNAILPENVRTYFFFDGEKMDDLTRADNKEVNDAIRNIMRLPALEKAEQHLSDIATEYRREIKKQGSPELENLIAREEDLRSEKDRCFTRRDEIKEEIRLARQHVEDLEALLREKEGAKRLQKDRDRAQDQLAKLESQRETEVKSIQEAVNRSYLNLIGDAAQRALTILNEKREKGEIPSGIREQFVQDLLDQMVCVCGRPFSEHDEVYSRLHLLLQRSTSSELENEVLKLGGNLRAMSNQATTQIRWLGQLMKEKIETEDTIEYLYKELEQIKHQLSKMPEEDISGLEKQRTKFQRDVELNIAEQRSNDDRIKQIDLQMQDIIRRKREAEAKERKLSLLARQEEIAQRAADAIAKIKEEFFEYSRREIESATKEVFAKLAWKQDHFQDVQLDQDFRLEVIDRWGMPTRKELSAGERQILSLAFITAMSKVSREDAPLVMDTPFGRLSGNHLSAVAENLPDLTSQLVLFVTDREWDEASKTSLEPKAGAQYELKFNPKTGCTDIVEVEW